MNVNIEIQFDAELQEYDQPRPLTFGEIETIRAAVAAPVWSSMTMTPEAYGWEIHIHWNNDPKKS